MYGDDRSSNEAADAYCQNVVDNTPGAFTKPPMFNLDQAQIAYTQSELTESVMLDTASIPSAAVSQWQSNVT